LVGAVFGISPISKNTEPFGLLLSEQGGVVTAVSGEKNAPESVSASFVWGVCVPPRFNKIPLPDPKLSAINVVPVGMGSQNLMF
jgi:hypothetical protein